MSGPITRGYRLPIDVAVATTEAACDELDKAEFASGSLQVPSGSSLTTLTILGSHTAGDAHVAVKDQDGAAVTMTVAAGQVYELPSAVFGVPFIKFQGNAAGTVSVVLVG